MKIYRVKQVLCILCIILYSCIVAKAITQEQSLLFYMLYGFGFVTLSIGFITYLSTEKGRCLKQSQQLFNMQISNYLYTIYLGVLTCILSIHLYLMTCTQITFIYKLPAIYCYFAIVSLLNYDMLILDKKTIYFHGKWYPYEEMRECRLEIHKQYSVFCFCNEELKVFKCEVKESESETFIESLKEYVPFTIKDVS